MQRAVLGLGVRDARLKWPNDVLVHGAKLAGILVEAPGALATPGYVVGMGINVAQESFPAWLLEERPVTSLALEGVRANVEQVLECVLAELGPALEELARDPARIEESYLAATGLAGAEVVVRSGTASARGRWVGFSLRTGVELECRGERVRLPVAHVTGIERDAGQPPVEAGS